MKPETHEGEMSAKFMGRDLSAGEKPWNGVRESSSSSMLHPQYIPTLKCTTCEKVGIQPPSSASASVITWEQESGVTHGRGGRVWKQGFPRLQVLRRAERDVGEKVPPSARDPRFGDEATRLECISYVVKKVNDLIQ